MGLTYTIVELGARLEQEKSVNILDISRELIDSSRHSVFSDLGVEEPVSESSCVLKVNTSPDKCK